MRALVDEGAALGVRAGSRRAPEGAAEVDRAEAEGHSSGTKIWSKKAVAYVSG